MNIFKLNTKSWTLLLLILSVLIHCFINADRISLDGIGGEVGELVMQTDTKYSNNYSHNNFRKIKMGMTEKQVINLLGKPLIEWKPYQFTMFKDKIHYIGFQYSESPSSTNYRLRQVYFDNGKVAEIISYFYID